ncbi:MAG TPA: hypothetical protein VG456_28595 [Candidatus Sulfopaludibacter sp.]|jgi:uncharacterized protein (TIGR03437 family)|nr:hypothetical protein [Candidatus Sulfopaludibacter sp.]
MFTRVALLLCAAVVLAQSQTPVITSVINNGSLLAGPIAPGMQVNITGSNLGDPTSVTCGGGAVAVPTVCSGVSVLVNGNAAPVRTEGANGGSFYVPIDTPVGSATVQVSRVTGGQTLTSNVFSVTVAATAPGLFTTTVNNTIFGNFQTTAGVTITPGAPAKAGDTIKVLGTGFGVTNPLLAPGTTVPASPAYNIVAPVKVTVGGKDATVVSAARIPNGLGATDQAVFTVPAGLTGSQPVVVNVGGVNSQTLQLPLTGGPTAPTITGVAPAAGGSTLLAPGDQAFINGTNLGTTGVSAVVGGKPAFVLNTNANGVLVQIPVDAPIGATTVVVGTSAPFNITLSQFAPALPPNTNSGLNNGAFMYHLAAQTLVTTTSPASPNEQVALIAYGLGPTSPVVPTGQSANDLSNVTTTVPTIILAGQSVPVSYAAAAPGQVGAYAVVFTVPASTTNGNQNVSVRIGGVTSNNLPFPVSTAPIISQVVNAASYIPTGLPNAGIAQGSIFVIKGNNLGPATLTIAPQAFQSTSLAGTSVSVTVAGSTVAPTFYYTSAGQLALLMPSNTPTGTGTISVTYNDQTGPTAPITVVASTAGIFTVTSDGQGSGIVTYADYSLVSALKAANCGGVYTTCGAANPGDVLIIWATGLGPVNGTDASGAGLGVNMASLPLKVWLGGVQATVAYQGRSGCCIGEDQVVITVPAGVPTGCSVPLSIQIGNFISNTVLIPVANGSRTCTPANPTLSTANVLQLSSGAPVTFADIELRRTDNFPGFTDSMKAEFARVTIDPALQPFIATYIDNTPPGACSVQTNLNGGNNPPFATAAGLDAGAQLTVTGPNGTKTVPGGTGSYQATLSATGNYLVPGSYTVSSPGGADVKAFTANVTLPAMPVMTSPTPDSVNAASVTRSSGTNVTWTGGGSNVIVQISGFNYTDTSNTIGAQFQCTTPPNSNSFTVPASVLLALPTGTFGGISFDPTAVTVVPQGGGLTLMFISSTYDYYSPINWK